MYMSCDKQSLNDSFSFFSDREFLITVNEGKRLTFKIVNESSSNIAKMLDERGVKAKDYVLIHAENDVSVIFAFYAALKLGAIPILINPETHEDELQQIQNSTNSKVLISRNYHSDILRTISYETILEHEKFGSRSIINFPDLDINDIITVLYTSGSTSIPKGVKLKGVGTLQSVTNFSKLCQINTDSIIFQVMPLYHGTGWYTTLIVPLLKGSTVVLAQPFNLNIAANYWKIIEKYKINYLIVIPSIINTLLSIYPHKIKRDKKLIANCSSDILLVKTKREFEERYDITIIEDYSSTEAGVISITEPNQTNDSVGKLAQISNVKISEEGEILVKCNHYFSGYIKHESVNRMTPDGWYKTGDIGIIKDEYLYLQGRKDDMIVRNGINIYPSKIDNEILKFDPCIINSFTVGIKDKVGNTNIYTCLQLSNNQDSKFLKQLFVFLNQKLDRKQLPDKFLILDKFPENKIGKIDKNKIKEHIELTL